MEMLPTPQNTFHRNDNFCFWRSSWSLCYHATSQASHSLPGRFVTLEPGGPFHFDGLFDVLGEENAAIWDYIPNGPFLDHEEFRVALTSHLHSPNSFLFTIINNASGKVVGSIALINIDPSNHIIEAGYVLFSSQLQHTVAATEVMYLLAGLVFDKLSYRRYERKCDNLNEPSKRAALRLGFTFEGVFRQHMVIKRRNRDTAWFSMLDREWPAVKREFERWLDKGNFDEQGKQREVLVKLRDDPQFATA